MKIYFITGILISILIFSMYLLIKINGDVRKKSIPVIPKS